MERTPELKLQWGDAPEAYVRVTWFLGVLFDDPDQHMNRLRDLVSACTDYEKYTHEHPESRSGKKGCYRLWFVKAVRSAAIKNALKIQQEKERRRKAAEMEAKEEKNPKEGVPNPWKQPAWIKGSLSDLLKVYKENPMLGPENDDPIGYKIIVRTLELLSGVVNDRSLLQRLVKECERYLNVYGKHKRSGVLIK